MVTEHDPTPWERIPQQWRTRVVWSIWFVTLIGLLAGFRSREYWHAVVILSAIHAVLVLALSRFRLVVFPVQVRFAYLLWVAAGTYVPGATVMMLITSIGLTANLLFGYCPLARMLYLLPMNRGEAMSASLLVRTFLSPPSSGRFTPLPSRDVRPESAHG